MNGQGCEQLTLFREDSPASRLVLPGSDEAQKMTVTSGQKCLELYKNSSPVGLLAKMLLGSSTWRSTRCYLTWKVSATPAKRLLFRLAPSMPRTGVTGVQSWPTPTASDTFTWALESTQQKPVSRHSVKLSDAVRMWSTPTAADATGSSGGNMHSSLRNDAGGQLNPTWAEWLMGFPIGWTELNALETQ